MTDSESLATLALELWAVLHIAGFVSRAEGEDPI
jgi:hypothetical protein